MPLEDLDSPEAVEAFKSQNAGGALICFSATWCGPCKASKPQLEALAASYDADGGAVAVGIAYEHNLGDAVHAASVRAFPTYVLYVRRTEKGRVEGVNFDGIRAMVSKAGCKKEWGGGQGLGGGGQGGRYRSRMPGPPALQGLVPLQLPLRLPLQIRLKRPRTLR